MRAARLQDALERLTAAVRDVECELAAMKAERDPLASHIFVSRRHYRTANDTKSGKRREVSARVSFNTALRTRLSRESRRMGTTDGGRLRSVN
jgi:predicted RNase H-like nuclease (RuvC/YqgF family)